MDSKPVPTILLTGFLGSGKTTFLNMLLPYLHQQGLRVGVLVNELGDVALDAVLVHKSDHVAEVVHGSIFCACTKGDLVKAIQQITEAVHPDVLVVEATGVADPGELGGFTDLHAISLYRLAYTVCLAAAGRVYKVTQTLAAARRQLQVANLVVVTGSDTTSAKDVEQSLAAISKHAPQANVVVAPFAQIPNKVQETILHAVMTSNKAYSVEIPQASADEPLERARDLYSTRLVQVGNLQAQEALQRLVALLPAGTERAKGLVSVDGKVQVYQYRGGVATLDPAPVGAVAPGWLLAIGRYPAKVTFGHLSARN